jgi:putative ABC transport system permease protein
MAITNRMREIGMLHAIGMGPFRLFVMVILESVFLSFTGGLAGAVLGYFTNRWMREVGLDLSMFSEALSRFGLEPVIYFHLSPKYYVWALLMVVLMAVLSALYPAWRAIRRRPANALRTF